MKNCVKCGTKLADNSDFCGWCGTDTRASNDVADSVAENSENYEPENRKKKRKSENPDDAPSVVLGIICFFIPWLGLILFMVWGSKFPRKADSCGIGGLIGVLLGIVGIIWLVQLALKGITILALIP